MDFPVEPARPKQRLIQILRPIGGGNHHHPIAALEAIHCRQKRVDRLLHFAMRIELAALAKTIDLVNEDNRRSMFAGLPENLSHSLRANPDKHFVEIAAVRAKEMRLSLAGNRSGQHGLSRPWRPHQQNAFREIASQSPVFLRIPQKIHNLSHFRFGFFNSGHILEARAGAEFHFVRRLGFADAHLMHHQHSNQSGDD